MWATVLSVLIAIATASPYVNFPLNLQFPPVARVGEPYSFQFAATTFQPSPEQLQYFLIGNPNWLSLNGKNRTLWGTPGAGDAGNATFTIAAAGEAGAVVNMESRLFVTDTHAPNTKANVSEQLLSVGQLTGLKALTLSPSKPFDINFSQGTFEAGVRDFSYHATLADHTPLPSWISFDASSVRFAGVTPPLNSSPQSFDILLIASDIPGYAAASVLFTLIISNHQLLFKPLQRTVDVTKGDTINLSELRKYLFLDNSLIEDEDIQDASAELPSWLSFNNQTFDITGTPPPGLMSQDLSLTVKDKYGDTAKQSIRVMFKSQLFNEEIGALNITVGERFDHHIPRSILASDNEQVDIDLGSLAEWLKFDLATLTVSGMIPRDANIQDTKITVTATSSDGKAKDLQTVPVNILSSNTHNNSESDNAPSSKHPDSTDGDSNMDEESHQSKKAGMIAGSVIAALTGSLIIVAFSLLLYRRRKTSKGYVSPRSPRSPRKTDISRPILIQDEWDAADKSFDRDPEKGEEDDTLTDRTPEHPPQLNLDLNLKRNDSHSPANSIDDRESKLLNAFDSSPWDFKDEAGPSHQPHDSMKIPTAIARRESEALSSPIKYRRRTTVVYRDSQRSSGLPLNRRLTGLGHGHHTYSPSHSKSNVSAYRRPLSFHSYTTQSTSILSTVPSAFPQPPAARHTTQLTTPMEKRCSIRLVSKNASATCESLLDRKSMNEIQRSNGWKPMHDSLMDRRTLDERRRSYIRKRASAQSPFFSSSRVSSSSYKSPPAFINEAETPSRPAPSPLATSVAVRPDEDLPEKIERELPESLRIRKPSQAASVETSRTFAGSLRGPRTERSFVNKNTTTASSVTDRDRVHKRYERPSTAVHSGACAGRRSSTRHSLRAAELKSSLNSLTESKIYEDAELSQSVYSTEEEDIEEYEKRTTVRPSQFSLPPLDLYRLRKGKRDSKRDTKRNSKRESKRLSQRNPTPYALALEHGGKENQSSTYSLSLLPPTVKGKTKVTDASRSPERPKTIATTNQHTRPARHSRSESKATARSSAQRNSQTKPPSRRQSHQANHTRTQSKSAHSRSQSRQSTTKIGRDRSRTQSSAFPHFDISTLPTTLADPSKPTKDANASVPNKETAASLLPRDSDGNIVNYALHEDPMIQELDSSSIGFRTSNGRVNSDARRSRLVQQMSQSQPYTSSKQFNAKRDTTIAPSTSPSHPHVHAHSHNPYTIGLGLSLLSGSLGRAESTPGRDSERGRERTPFSVLDDGNGASPERLRIVEGKARRPVSGEVDEELKVGASRKGRTTWGSWKKVMGRAGGYWEGRDRETKAFL